MYKYLLLLSLTTISVTNSFSQPLSFSKIDKELTETYKSIIKSDFQKREDSLVPLFKSKIVEYLKEPSSFNIHFDSLENYISIINSPDGKVKFYSWDNLDGGSWHNITCIAQYMSPNGKIYVKQINTEDETETGSFTDSEIYEIHEVIINNKTHYLTFGKGSHGSAKQHQIIQIFSIENNQLIKCDSCFINNKEWIIEYPRTINLSLSFDEKLNEISYKEFKIDETTGFGLATGKVITLKFIKGILTILN